MVYFLALAPLLSLITLTGASNSPIACTTVPANGAATLDSEGTLTFECQSQYELVGAEQARCVNDILDIRKLPVCVLKKPATTHVKSRYFNVLCNEEEIEKRKEVLTGILSAVECLRSGDCTFNEFKHICPGLNEIEIEAIFTVSGREASSSIKNFMSGSHSRRKRQSDFDDLDPETSEVSDCSDGEGLSADGDTCVTCQAGFYSFNDTCTECAVGTYQNDTGQTECDDCSGSLSTISTASDDVTDCVDACTLPSSSVDSVFTIDNVEQSDGSNLTPGTSITLLCDTDYTYQGESSVVLECTDSATTVHNECYKVLVSPTGDVYKFSNETVEFTCSVDSEIGVDSFTLNSDASDSGATAADMETDGTTVSQTFTVTNDTGDGAYTCDAFVNGNSDAESSGDSTDVAFVTFSITPEETVNAADTFTITAKLTYNSDLTSTEFTWTLDDEELLTNIDTSSDSDYFYSKIQISSVSLDDAGMYRCTTTVKDLSGTQQLESTLGMMLNVKGFTIQPADEYTSDSTTLQENEELVLTCAVSGSAVSAEDVEWWLDDSSEVVFAASTASDGSIVNTLSGEITTSILTVTSISSSYTGIYSCKVGTLQSEDVTVAMTDYTIVMGSTARCGEAGEDQEITCTASYPSSLSTAPTISWYQAGTSNDSLLSDGENYVLSSTQDGTDYNSVLTLKDVAAGDTYEGSYYCIAVYTDPSYISITATGQTTFTVVGLNDMATQYALIGDTGITFSTSFYGEAPMDASWEYNSNTVDSSIGSVDVSSGSGASFSLALGTIALDTIASYDAKVELDSCADDVSDTLTTTATLEILSVNITSNAEYVFDGETISIDCEFANPASLSSSPTVTWTVGGVDYTGSDIDNSATNSNPVGSESLTISSATESNASTYACVVVYTPGTVTEEVAVTVLGGNMMDSLYLLSGEDDTFTCTFFGGDGTVSWTKSGDDATDLSSMVTTDPYSGGQLESRLALTNVSTDEEGEYNCEISFTDYSETKTTQARLYIMSVTVSGDSVINLGDDATLDCDEGDHTGNYSWSKDGETIDGQTTDTLSLSTATFDTAGNYVCTVVYDDDIGTVSSDDHNLFVEDFVSLAQINMTGDYNEVGETVTLSAVLMASSVPSVFELYDQDTSAQLTITNVPSATETDGTDDEYTVTIEFTAISNSDANDDVTLRLVCTTVDIETTVATKIYEPCVLPDVADIPSLSGGSLSHMEDVEDMRCTDSYIAGGTTVSCDNGALTYSPSTDQPSCTVLSIATNPASQLVSVDDIVTLTCATDELTLDITSVVWSDEDGDLYTDDSPVASGSTVYTSEYSFTAAEADNAKKYRCSVITTAGDAALSDNATIYIVGVKSGAMSSPGDYFESDKQGGEFSEDATITFEIYEGPGGATVAVSLVLVADEVLIPDVAFLEGSTVDNVITYTYELSETYKESGTYTVNVTYDSSLTGAKTFEEDLFVPVYEFCAISDLSEVSSGTWSPTTMVSFMSYASLTCSDGSYIEGEGTTRCEAGTATSQFDIETYPTCEVETDLSCGSLESTDNGDVVYVNSSAGYYSCDSDYSLIGDQETYTCASNTGDWSIVTSDNPYGDAPVCQVVAEPESRYANITLVLGVSGGSTCQDAAEVEELRIVLQSTLEEDEILECTGDYLCTLINFECVYDSSEVTVDFTLWQSGALTDATVLTDHVALFDNIGSVTFEVSHSSRKRATVSVVGQSAVVTTTTTCTADYVTDGDDCVECPGGYGYYSTACTACAVGSYSTGDSVDACTACAGSLTTRLVGSDSADDCIAAEDVCTVSTAQAEASLSPPGASRVNDDSTITITCNSGYGLEINSSDTVRCDEKPYPTCHEKCSLAMYTTSELADRYIHDNLDAATMVHNEQIQITCQSGYQFEADLPVKTFTCSDGTLPDFGSCVETSGSAVLTTVIVCVVVLAVAIIFLFLFILVQWRKKKNDAYKVNAKQPQLEMGARNSDREPEDPAAGPSCVQVRGADDNIYMNENQ